MSITEVANQRGVRMTVAEMIAGLALIVTIFTAINGWLFLPEQVKQLRDNDTKQDVKIEVIQKEAAARSEILARIDERTKRIEDGLKAKGL